MTEPLSIRCLRCEARVDFYDGQGMFRCGSCGALYESAGGGFSGVRMISVAEERPAPGPQMPPQSGGSSAPHYQIPQAGQPGLYGMGQQHYQVPVAPPVYAPPYAAYQAPRVRAGRGSDFVRLKWFVTPPVVAVLFWVLVAVSVGLGVMFMVWDPDGYGGPSWWQYLLGLFFILLGPVFSRIWCERQVVHFQVHDQLKELNRRLSEKEEAEEAGEGSRPERTADPG